MKTLLLIVTLAFGAFTSSGATAAVLKVDYSGTFNTTFGGFPGTVSLSGSFTYTEPTPGGTTGVLSFATDSSSVFVDGILLGGSSTVNTGNDIDGTTFLRDRYSHVQNASAAQFLAPNIRLIAAGFNIENDGTLASPPTMMTNLLPPTDAAFLLAFGGPIFASFENLATGGSFSVQGSLDTLVITDISDVPLPAGLPIFISGIAFLSASIRRRKTAHKTALG